MEKWILLLVVFLSTNIFASTVIATGEKAMIKDYQVCLNHSNKLNNPFERDQKKISCFARFKKTLNVTSCISLSKKLEYSSMSEELLSDCLEYFGSSPNECLRLSKSMIYGESKDAGLWSCLALESTKQSKKTCLQMAGNMTLPHNKNRALEFCMYQNGL